MSLCLFILATVLLAVVLGFAAALFGLHQYDKQREEGRFRRE